MPQTDAQSWLPANTTELTRPPMNPPTFLDIIRQYQDYKTSRKMILYGCSLQIAVGTATNLLTMVVMTRRTMIKSTTCFYFAVLALVDLMVLYFSCLRHLLLTVNGNENDVYVSATWTCRLLNFLAYFSYDLASWIITAMTIDRSVGWSCL